MTITVLGEIHITGSVISTRRITARKSQCLMKKLAGDGEVPIFIFEAFWSNKAAGVSSGLLDMGYRYSSLALGHLSVAGIHKGSWPVLRKMMNKQECGKRYG